MANLIEYIQSQVYENSTEDISGSIMQQVLTRMASDEGVVNVHTISGQTPFADYNNAQAARDAVPAGFKKLGLIITYKLSSGWYIDEFIGSATSGWSTSSNWKCLGPISVSQNASTGKTTITIGSESFDVATQPVSVSQNTSTKTNIKIGDTDNLIDTPSKEGNTINEEFAIADENGNAIIKLDKGEIETKNFQSINAPKIVNSEAVDDFIIEDENKNAIVKFGNGGIETKEFDSIKTPNIEDGDSFDFALSDKNGKHIALFQEGHIITRNFDSREITKKKLQDVKFSILGDSISTYQGYLVSDSNGYDGADYRAYYGNPEYSSPLGDVNLTWWKKLIEKSGMSLIQNCAWSGSRVAPSDSNPVDSTTNAAAGCSLRRISDLAFGSNDNPNIIIVAIGVNDMGQNVSLGTWDGNQVIPTPSNSLTFSESYALMLYRIMTTYPNAEVYCCTMLETSNPGGYDPGQDGFPAINAGGKSIMDFNNVIKSVALAVGAKVIDTHSCGVTYWNISSMSVDGNQHPNAKGMDLICNCIYKELITKSKFSNL